MEEILAGLSPAQKFLLMAFNIWFYIVFPIFVIRKLNYLTRIMEAQMEPDEPDSQEPV